MTSPDHLAQALAGAAVAVVRPGDSLVFAMINRLTDEEADYLSAQFRQFLPEGVRVGFIDHCSGIVVVRPDGDQ